MFINLSNHPSNLWDNNQLSSAQTYGEIKDIAFPVISPEWSTEQVAEIVKFYFRKINLELSTVKKTSAIHIAGEPVFCFLLIQSLLKEGYTVLTSTTERTVIEEGNTKTSVFKFIKFREYTL